MIGDWWPVGVYVLLVGILGLVLLVLWRILSPNRPSPAKQITYESGMIPVGEAQRKFTVRYYIVAMLFVLFDIEAIFLYPWAVVFDRIGLFALVEMILFIAMIVVAYVYAWRKGALDWV